MANFNSWKCATYKDIIFHTSSLAMGILFGNFSQSKGMLSENFGKKRSNGGNFSMETQNLAILVSDLDLRLRKFGNV